MERKFKLVINLKETPKKEKNLLEIYIFCRVVYNIHSEAQYPVPSRETDVCKRIFVANFKLS